MNITTNTEPNLERLINLFSFVYNMHDFPQEQHSPDCILEKWNHWVGVKLTPNVMESGKIVQFHYYKDKWKIKGDDGENIKIIFYFLSYIEDLDVKEVIKWFRYFGGDLRKIHNKKKTGLHIMLYRGMENYFDMNEDLIIAYLREMKIDSIINE